MSSIQTRGLSFVQAVDHLRAGSRVARKLWWDNGHDVFLFIDSQGFFCECRGWRKSDGVWELANMRLESTMANDWMLVNEETSGVEIKPIEMFGPKPLVIPESLFLANQAVQEMWKRRYDTNDQDIPDASEGEPFGSPVAVDLGQLALAQSELRSLVPEVDPDLGRAVPEGLRLKSNQEVVGFIPPSPGAWPSRGPRPLIVVKKNAGQILRERLSEKTD